MPFLPSSLKYTIRELRKRPGFALTAILSIALGIGATTAVFSVIYAVLIDPFPYPHSDRIVEIHLIDKAGHDRGVGFSGPQMVQLRKLKSIENVVALDEWNLTTTDSDLPEDVQAGYLSSDAATQFGIPAMLGRWFIKSDAPFGEEPQRVVVLTYQFWQRYYGGDPAVIGRNLQLVHKNYRVIGVMPPRFRWNDVDIYVPQKLTSDPKLFFGSSLKLRPGVTSAQASAEVEPLIEQFAKAEPTNFPDHFRVKVRSIIDVYARPLGPTLYLLLGGVGVLLLIGCANVSILLLARGARRQHEIAVRVAVGAKRADIVGQLLAESLVIAITGAALGVAVAWGGLSLIARALPQGSFPAESVIRVNLPVLLFSIALACATALIFGLSPALRLSTPNVASLMQSSLRRIAGAVDSRRTHRILVASQVALTVILLASAGAAGRGFLRLLNTNLGYDPRNVMSVPIPVHETAHHTWSDRSRYFENLRAKIATIPQVEVAGISTNATPPSNGNTTKAEIMGSTAKEAPEIRLNFVSPEYFTVLRIPLLHGRMMDHTETMRGAPLAVVNETMARLYWPNGDAIGKAIRIPGLKDSPPYNPAVPASDGWLRIVGVVADARDDGLRKPIIPAAYIPYTVQMRMFTQILVRASVPPLTLLKAVRQKLIEVDPDQQAMKTRDLNEWITTQQEYAQQRLVAALFGIFAVLALALAAVGLYSVVSYAVANRTSEFGVRMALGARRSDVMAIVLRDTAGTVAAGIAIGLIASALLDGLAAAWVTESSRDPIVIAGVASLLIAVSAMASLIPARRAASVDPMVALRYE